MKKILSVLLAIALLAGIMPLAMADENVPEAETPVQAEEQAQEEAVVPFTGRLTLFNCRPLIHGEMAYLKANVENANKSFSIFWDKLVQEEWERIPGAVGDCLSFAVDKTYGDYSYRAVLRAEDGTILTAEITVSVERPAPQEPAQEEPAASEPEGNEPEASQPEVNEPAANEPETTEPQVSEPEVNEPAADEPETTEPQANEPEVTEPAASEPEADEPKADEPEAAAPAASEPEATEPETTEPEAAAPGAAEPEVTEPETTEPEASEPEAAEPEVTEPETTEQEVSEPETIEPETTEPEVTEPEATEQEATEAEAAEPEAADPESAEPEETEPETTEPEVTEPEVTEPDTAESEEEEPAAEEPEAEEPEAEEPADEEPAAGATVLDVEDEIVEDVNLDEEDEEIEDYETPLGASEENTAPVYSYERDENGVLVLDENGNPIVTVIEGDEIPVTYLRNEDGELILDEKGDPIPTQTVPTDAVISNTIVDALNPDRTIDIYYSWNNQKPAIGGDVTFIAVLHGYENLEYSIQWQQSKNGSDWADVAGSNETRYTETITRDNYKDFWRVQVSIIGIEE